ncbi:hypothetical protein, partial [Shigella flexneri]|uniref:hypothetical protein n=4 Tax=Shigella flexneri TaxID=623 RepID=UPI000B2E1F3B
LLLMPFYFRKECPLNSGYLSQSRMGELLLHPGISTTEASMNNNNTLYVGLDVHKESITVAYEPPRESWRLNFLRKR